MRGRAHILAGRLSIKAKLTRLKKEPVDVAIDSIHIDVEEVADAGYEPPQDETALSSRSSLRRKSSQAAPPMGSEGTPAQSPTRGKKKYASIDKIVDGIRLTIAEVVVSLTLLPRCAARSHRVDAR